MKKVLCIEDESAAQKTLFDVLTQENYEVFSALDGEVGLRLAKSKKPDVILLDLILPKKNGFEVLKALKGDPETKEIPVIVLTNLEELENVQKAVALGATTYLVKANYNLDEVVRMVQKIVEK